jgi:hypothetical protein
VDVVVLVVRSLRYGTIVVIVSIVTKTIWKILSKTVVALDVLASGGQRHGMMWCEGRGGIFKGDKRELRGHRVVSAQTRPATSIDQLLLFNSVQ